MALGQNRQESGKLSFPGPEPERDCKNNRNEGERRWCACKISTPTRQGHCGTTSMSTWLVK